MLLEHKQQFTEIFPTRNLINKWNYCNVNNRKDDNGDDFLLFYGSHRTFLSFNLMTFFSWLSQLEPKAEMGNWIFQPKLSFTWMPMHNAHERRNNLRKWHQLNSIKLLLQWNHISSLELLEYSIRSSSRAFGINLNRFGFFFIRPNEKKRGLGARRAHCSWLYTRGASSTIDCASCGTSRSNRLDLNKNDNDECLSVMLHIASSCDSEHDMESVASCGCNHKFMTN